MAAEESKISAFVVSPTAIVADALKAPPLDAAVIPLLDSNIGFYAGGDVSQFQYDFERWLIECKSTRAILLVSVHGIPGSGGFKDSTPFQRGRRDPMSRTSITWTPELLWNGFHEGAGRPSQRDFCGLGRVIQEAMRKVPTHLLVEFNFVLAQSNGNLFSSALSDLICLSQPIMAEEGARMLKVTAEHLAVANLPKWLSERPKPEISY